MTDLDKLDALAAAAKPGDDKYIDALRAALHSKEGAS